MRTEAEIRMKGMKALIASLGIVDAEKFIALIHREPFDYTEWQKTLWEGMSVEQISQMAMENHCPGEISRTVNRHCRRFDKGPHISDQISENGLGQTGP